MGIFEDAAHKLDSEAAQKSRSEIDRFKALNQIANIVAEELKNDLIGRSQLAGVNIGIHGNVVHVGRAA